MFAIAMLVRTYYRRAYGLSHPRQRLSPSSFLLSMVGGLALGWAGIAATFYYVMKSPPISYWGVCFSLLLFAAYWPDRRIAGYWLVPVVLLTALSLLPVFGFGRGNDPYSVVMPIDPMIIAVLRIFMVICGCSTPIRVSGGEP